MSMVERADCPHRQHRGAGQQRIRVERVTLIEGGARGACQRCPSALSPRGQPEQPSRHRRPDRRPHPSATPLSHIRSATRPARSPGAAFRRPMPLTWMLNCAAGPSRKPTPPPVKSCLLQQVRRREGGRSRYAEVKEQAKHCARCRPARAAERRPMRVRRASRRQSAASDAAGCTAAPRAGSAEGQQECR